MLAAGGQFSTRLPTTVGVVSVVAQVFSYHTEAAQRHLPAPTIVGRQMQNCTAALRWQCSVYYTHVSVYYTHVYAVVPPLRRVIQR